MPHPGAHLPGGLLPGKDVAVPVESPYRDLGSSSAAAIAANCGYLKKAIVGLLLGFYNIITQAMFLKCEI